MVCTNGSPDGSGAARFPVRNAERIYRGKTIATDRKDISLLAYQVARRVDVRRMVVVLAGGIAGFALLGLIQAHMSRYMLQAFDLKDSDLDARISMPASFTSILLAIAALLAFSISQADKHSRRGQWRKAGWLLALLALEELLGLHIWLEHRGVPWNVCYFPLVLAAAVIFFDAYRILAGRRHAGATFLGATLLWLGAGLFAATAADRTITFDGIELLEMSAAALFVIALVMRCRYLAQAHHPIDEPESRPATSELVRAAVRSIDLPRLALALGVVCAAFAIQYVLLHAGNYHDAEQIRILDLNNEQTLWATFQGAIIWAVAGLALLASMLTVTTRQARVWWITLGIVLLVLGADEVIAIHDRFQDATGYPGQLILTPVALVGMAAWLRVLSKLWNMRSARTLFIGGAAFWACSQVSDILLNPTFRWTITPEELGETIGSGLWMFALLLWLRAQTRPDRDFEGATREPLLLRNAAHAVRSRRRQAATEPPAPVR